MLFTHPVASRVGVGPEGPCRPRASLARARSALRALLAWLVRRQRLVLARDISLPRHCDYLPAAVVRVCVYNCLCKVWHVLMWVL